MLPDADSFLAFVAVAAGIAGAAGAALAVAWKPLALLILLTIGIILRFR